MISRTTAREQAFILIFEKSFNDESVNDILELSMQIDGFVEDSYTTDIFLGVYENIEEIDNLISTNSKGWDISRIGRVALSLMRLSVFEMLKRDDVPISVSVNEAVELCKKYAAESDAAFLNGVLGTVARNIQKEG